MVLGFANSADVNVERRVGWNPEFLADHLARPCDAETGRIETVVDYPAARVRLPLRTPYGGHGGSADAGDVRRVPIDQTPHGIVIRGSHRSVSPTVPRTAKQRHANRHPALVRHPQNETAVVEHVGFDRLVLHLLQQCSKTSRKTEQTSPDQMHLAAQAADLIVERSASAGKTAKVEPILLPVDVLHQLQQAEFGTAAIELADDVQDVDVFGHIYNRRN